MTITIFDMFDAQLYSDMHDAGFIKEQRHPDFPNDLAIVNYTAKAQQNYHWNDVTEQCRGLIYNPETFEVVARPFRKFYNYDEREAPKFADDEIIRAFDKMDGSLGIIYPTPNDGQFRVATRGSFTSDQALWATNRLHSIGSEYFPNIPGYTDMVEIIYPDNRIVVGYGGAERLVYIGTIENDTGRFGFEDDMFDDSTELLYTGTFSGLFALPERQNAEGFVVVNGEGRRVKVKYEEYVRLHRIVSNLTDRYVWEYLGGPNPLRIEKLVSDMPEEHETWAREVAQRLFGQYISATMYLNEVLQRIDKLKTRKEKALAIQGEDAWVKGSIFAGLDGKSYMDIVWKMLRPKGD